MTKIIRVCVVAFALVSAGAVLADKEPPKAADPLTLEFAKSPVPPGACDAINAEHGEPEESFNGRQRLSYVLDPEMPVDVYGGLKGEARFAALAKDQHDLLQCERTVEAYLTVARIEQMRLRTGDKSATAARLLAALEVAVQLTGACNDPTKHEECPELLAYYAGALAEAGRHEEAFQSLKKAVELGMLAVHWFSTDPSLAALRKHPEWDKRLSAMLPPEIGSVPQEPKADLGFYLSTGYRAGTDYALCKDHRVITSDYMGEGVPPEWKTGRWELKPDGSIWVAFEHHCKSIEYDDQGEELPKPVVQCSEATQKTAQRFLSEAEARVFFAHPEHEEPTVKTYLKDSHWCGESYVVPNQK